MVYNRRKYNNIPDNRTTPGGRHIRFDSKKEADRYDDLISARVPLYGTRPTMPSGTSFLSSTLSDWK